MRPKPNSYFGEISSSAGNGGGGGGGGGISAVSPFGWVLVSKNRGRFSHMLLFTSDASDASEARDDLRDEALEPRCTCRKEERRPCQPPPGLEDCVISSTSPSSRSRFLLQMATRGNKSQLDRIR